MTVEAEGPSLLVEVNGVVPITRNEFGRNRPTYLSWVEAVKAAAIDAGAAEESKPVPPFSLKVELRTYSPWDQGSDLDNYIKDIQDALASADLFGTPDDANPMKGDEHIDHLEVRRVRVSTQESAGMTATISSVSE